MMRWTMLSISICLAVPTRAVPTDIFDFFEAEAQVITASLKPHPLDLAPATIYVVTAEDIRASGGRTLWDALRGVPGVDVMTTRAWHGEVGIRGFNRPLNNRVLVLLDGKTVLNGFFDFVTWEAIPVTLAEIDRIEIVEGPTSALYGANALSGVINIITKTPAQIQGSEMGYGIGQQRTHQGYGLYGKKRGDSGVRASAAWRSGNQFERGQISSQVFKTHAAWVYDPLRNTRFQVSGGFANHRTQMVMAGATGEAFNDGWNGFLRADYQRNNTQVRAFWNRGRSVIREFVLLAEPNTDYDTFDASAEHTLSLPYHNAMVIGASARRNTMQSKIFQDDVAQNLAALYFENTWSPRSWAQAVISGRIDRHPLAEWEFSPRGSALFRPSPEHIFRITAGRAFRFPTLTENHIRFDAQLPNPGDLAPNPPIETIVTRFSGNPDLKPERLRFLEAAHTGRFGPVKTTLTGFRYHLKDIISASTGDIQFAFPSIVVTSSFVNEGETTAWGVEAGIETRLHDGLSLFGNYAYQDFDKVADQLVAIQGGPRHKINAGVRLKRNGWLANATAHRVSGTQWRISAVPESPLAQVDAFYLVNVHMSYAFAGAWNGLELGIDAFNVTNRRHAQILPRIDAQNPGQSGEMLGRRVVVSTAYRF